MTFQIGALTPRADASEKVRGATKYATDFYGENMVWVGTKRAGIPHARLIKVDTSQAEKQPGVLRVLTAKDVPGVNKQGVIKKDQPVLVQDKIRHCGDAVALVLAESREALTSGLEAVSCEFEPLPGVFDPVLALKPGSPLVHEDDPHGNILLDGHVVVGQGLSAMDDCDAVVLGTFQTGYQEHAYLETEAGWAQLADDKLHLVCSTQTPFRDRMEIAEVLGMNPAQIRISAPYCGGAFGGKDGITVQSFLGLAAMHSNGRPVKMWLDREESFSSGAKRHPALMNYRLGAKADGTLHCLEAEIYLDTGPYDHLGGVVLALAIEHAGGPYRIPNGSVQGWAVYTNNPLGGAFRGFGVTQVTFAIEQMMDMLAERLGMDPLALRLKNALSSGDKNFVGATMTHSTGIRECLEVLNHHPLWLQKEEWKNEAPLFKKRGVGIAAVMHASGYGPIVPDFGNAKLELTTDGKFKIYCGVVDMGQGNASTNMQIAGALLNQTTEQFELVQPDTDLTLPSGSASASRCTYTFGNALIKAVETLRDRILQKVADILMLSDKSQAAFAPGCVRHLTTGREITLSRLAGVMNESERVAVGYFRAPTAPEHITDDPNLRLHGLPHALFSYGANLACVEVDELTGAIDVKHYVSINDCGRVINPQTYHQQIHGGMAQGLGYALHEDLSVEAGCIRAGDFSKYVIPTAADMPEMESIPVELHELTGPFGAKGIGEISTNGPAPAIANALADACGMRIFKAPILAEDVLMKLREKVDGE
jgi:CO/xanthine dehydrogenase Mo-binding subunit